MDKLVPYRRLPPLNRIFVFFTNKSEKMLQYFYDGILQSKPPHDTVDELVEDPEEYGDEDASDHQSEEEEEVSTDSVPIVTKRKKDPVDEPIQIEPYTNLPTFQIPLRYMEEELYNKRSMGIFYLF